MVMHESRSCGERLRGKKEELGNMGEGTRQGENLDSGERPVKGLLGVISGTR